MDTRSLLALLIAGAALAQPPITLFEPNGGEFYHVGDTMRVRWTADSSAALVNIEMCTDAGESGNWYLLTARAVGMGGPGWGDTSLIIADSLRDATTAVSTVSSQCLVRIRNYIDQVTTDGSDSVFMVAAPGAVRGRGRARRTGPSLVTYDHGVLTVRGAAAAAGASDLRGRLAIAASRAAPARLAPGTYLVRVSGLDGGEPSAVRLPVR